MLLWSLLVIFAPVDGKSDWLTLVAPSAVFEGDRIDLTCQKKNDRWKVKRVSYYKDGEELQFSSKLSNCSIQRAVLSDSGTYHCAVSPVWSIFPFQKEKTSRSVRIEVQELFPRPVLTVSPFRAIEGNPVTLTCETKLSPQRSDAQLRFCFFRDGRALGSGWSSSPELRVPAMWSGDSGSYWCEAETVTPSVRKQSLQSQIHVRRVPVSNVSLEMRVPRGQVIEGRNLVLLCSVTEGTGNITFSWHREATGTSVGKKTQRSLSGELEVPAVQERDAGRYYCRADNGHGPIQSKVLSILVRIPASRPILSITAPRAQAVEGDVVELRCEVQRGSPPILYRFYHEDVPLGNSSAPSGGGASFNLSLTAEHSGNYSCEADNGLGAQRSEVVPLSLSVPASRPVLTVRTPRAQAVEGDVVELHCEAQRGSPPILYRFYREDVPLGSSSAPSGGGASLNLSLTAEHSGNYSCEANNGLRVQRSKMVSLSITVPVSHPVLTLNPDVAQAMVGDVLELRCEAQRGSPPILYWFYHEDVILGNTSAPFGGGASFNLSLTTEHSGNYSCGADNGLGAQSSETVSLNITGLCKNKVTHITVGVIGCLLSMLGLAATAALVGRFRTQRKSGAIPRNIGSVPGPDPPAQALHSPRGLSRPALMELQPLYSNVSPGDDDLVYSQIWIRQHREGSPAHSPRTHQKGEVFHQEPAIVYSEVKRADPYDPARQDCEEAAEGYENVPCTSLASDH
ncbi:Fc receptor-like protein 2 isoform X9 [Panthera leo]|uniref:Fc receptor-like protein 2 isoform X9 n=1 Tax=Panthera leo TaxID=9689 RepID=UPI001C6A644D|nr:Fc receptor-like protein 2 isoform X9 [Panthera leo]